MLSGQLPGAGVDSNLAVSPPRRPSNTVGGVELEWYPVLLGMFGVLLGAAIGVWAGITYASRCRLCAGTLPDQHPDGRCYHRPAHRLRPSPS